MDKTDLSQILFILIDILSQPCDLLKFNFLIIWVISSLIETLSITLSDRSWQGNSVIEFLTRKH